MKSLFALNKYLLRYKWTLLFGFIFVIISNWFVIFPAQIVRKAFDLVGDKIKHFQEIQDVAEKNAIIEDLTKNIILYSLIILGLAILRGIFVFGIRQTIIAVSRKIEADLKKDIYQHYQELDIGFFKNNRTGDLMARASEDVSRVRMYLGPGIMYSLNTVVLITMLISTMFSVNTELTLYALAPLPVLSILVFVIQERIQFLSDKIQSQLSKLTAFTQEVFSGLRVVKTFTREKDFEDKFNDETLDYKNRSLKLAKVHALFFPAIIFLMGISTIFIVWIGSEKVVENELSIGNIAEFLLYVLLLTWPIVSIGWVSSIIIRAAASQTRINEFLKQKSNLNFPEKGNSISDKAALEIQFKNVEFTYENTGIKALKNLNLTAKSGEKIAIIGKTGSGKSTLLQVLQRFYDVDSGSILVNDKNIKSFTKSNLRNLFSYVPQETFLFSDTITNNIAFGNIDAKKADIENAAKSTSVHQDIMDFPNQYETILGERGINISGGQKQRISIARAWIKPARILILDDSLSAVDNETEERIIQNIDQLMAENPNMIVIVVSHRISIAKHCDKILVLENGELVESGTHDSLIDTESYYQKIYRKQILEAELYA